MNMPEGQWGENYSSRVLIWLGWLLCKEGSNPTDVIECERIGSADWCNVCLGWELVVQDNPKVFSSWNWRNQGVVYRYCEIPHGGGLSWEEENLCLVWVEMHMLYVCTGICCILHIRIRLKQLSSWQPAGAAVRSWGSCGGDIVYTTDNGALRVCGAPIGRSGISFGGALYKVQPMGSIKILDEKVCA